MRVTADDEVKAFTGRVFVPREQLALHVTDEKADAGHVALGFHRQLVAQVRSVQVTGDGGDLGDRAQRFQHRAVAHIAGMDDVVHPGEQSSHPRMKVAVRVGDDADAHPAGTLFPSIACVNDLLAETEHADARRVACLAVQFTVASLSPSATRRDQAPYQRDAAAASSPRRPASHTIAPGMRGLSGKTVVITGGTSGIGAATAQRFREEGCSVVVLARRPGEGVIPTDVADAAQVERAFAQIARVDVVINNAGISYRTPALQIGRDQWDRVVGTNLTGVFQVAQAAARRMLPAGGGLIVNVASTNALFGYPLYADYNATKAGVLALTRTLAIEWAPTVRVVAVCPGYVLTPMQEAEYSPEMMAQVNARIPLKRHAAPEEIAALFAFLASDECPYFTGSSIVCDGGETAGSSAGAGQLEG
jgi:meso-butanediol dehydrogenase / (S,S)-butanediol dehydrogenase / diacetyl reductase